MMWPGQCEVTMAHTKFGVNMSKLCRDTASDAVWHLSSKFVDALNKNCFVYRHKIHKFDQLSLKMIKFCENRNNGLGGVRKRRFST